MSTGFDWGTAAEPPDAFDWSTAAEPAPDPVANDDAALRTMREAAADTTVAQEATVQELSRKTGVAPDIVAADPQGIQKAADASAFDVEKWKTEYPHQAQLALEHPELGKLIVTENHDADLNVFSKAWNKAVDALQWLNEQVPELGYLGQAADPRKMFQFGEWKSPQELATETGKQLEASRAKPRTEALVEDPKFNAARKAFGDLATVPLIGEIRYREAAQQQEISQLGWYLMRQRALGKDTSEIEKRIVDLKATAFRRNLHEGPWEAAVGDVGEALASQVEIMKDAGPIGGTAAGLAFLGTLLATKSPGAALDASVKVGSVAGKVGVGYGSMKGEGGGAYLDMIDPSFTTDDGQPVPEPVARGFAFLYGVLAAGVEVASLDQLLKLTGPIAAGLRTGERKAVLRELLRNENAKAFALRLGGEFLKDIHIEAREEFIQSALEDIGKYSAKWATSGQLPAGSPVDIEKALTSYQTGAVGALGLALPAAGIHLTTEAMRRDRSAMAGRQVEAIAGLAKSPIARAAPEVVAELIKRQSEETGEPVTHLYADPSAFTRFFQSQNTDPKEAANSLLGPDGARRLFEARVTGDKIEIPVKDYLEKWGGSEAAQALAADITTSPALMTTNERIANANEIMEDAKRIQAAAVPALTAESDFVRVLGDRLEKELSATGKLDEPKVAKMISVMRAWFRTTAKRAQIDPEKLFSDVVLSIERGNESSVVPRGALAQTEKYLMERVPGLTSELRARELYFDPVMGLLNKAGWEALPKPRGSMIGVATFIDAKAINDHPLGGHDTANAVFASAAQAVHSIDALAGRHGTNVFFTIKDNESFDGALAKIQESLPAGFRVEGAIGYSLEKALQKLDKQVEDKRAKRVIPERGQTDLDLDRLPQIEQQLQPAPVNIETPEALIEKAGSLSNQDFYNQTYWDGAVKGVLSATGWNAIRRKAHVASVDLKGLRLINETFNKKVGNMVLHMFAELALAKGGARLDLAHLSGDEYALQSDSKADLEGFLTSLEHDVADVVIMATSKDGTKERVYVDFRFGIGEKTYGAADRALNTKKRSEAGRVVELERKGLGLDRRNPVSESDGLEVGRPSADAGTGVGEDGGNQKVQVEPGAVSQGVREEAQAAGREPGQDDTQSGELDASFDVAALEAELKAGSGLVQELKAKVSRMRNPEKRAEFEKWIAYCLGETDVRPVVSRETESVAAEFGLVDPVHGFEPAITQGITEAQIKRDMWTGRAGPATIRNLPQSLKHYYANQGRGGKGFADRYEQAAFHGSPHQFEKFSLHKIGTGEGAQVYGWGLYFAGRKEVAEYYRRKLSPKETVRVDGLRTGSIDEEGRANAYALSEIEVGVSDGLSPEQALSTAKATIEGAGRHARAKGKDATIWERRLDAISAIRPEQIKVDRGQLYKVDVPEDSELLDYDKPLAEQSPNIIAALEAGGVFPRGISRLININKEIDAIAERPMKDWAKQTKELTAQRDSLEAERKQVVERMMSDDGAKIKSDNWDANMLRYFTGSAIYRDMSSDPKQASESLRQLGIPGLRYLDGTSRSSGEGSYNYVIWDDQRVKVEQTFYQEENGPRGYTTIQREAMGRIIKIALNPSADLSTFLHESGHTFFELFADVAETATAPESIKRDFSSILTFMGVESRDQVKKEHHEKFARAFEAYLMEGNAPSEELRPAFDRFKAWLVGVYRSIVSLNVELNDEIRGVFDRMLATDDEIAAAKRQMGLEPLFRSPEEAGMSPAQWRSYLEDQERATSHAARAAELRTLKERLRETEAWWKEEAAAEKAQAEKDYEELPARRAQTAINGKHPLIGSPISFDRQAVEEAIGVEKGRRFRLRKNGGEMPDDWADLGPFPTGRAMLEAIVALQEKGAWVKTETARRMAEKHPDLLTKRDELRALVSKGLHGDFTEKWLLREWAALKSKTGTTGTAPVESIKRAAKSIAQGRPVRTLNVGGALAVERSAAEKAARASARGDYEQALVFKQQQLLNMYLHRELLVAREARDKFEERAAKLTKLKARERLGKAGREYVGGIDLLLEAFGLKRPEPREEPLPSIGEVVLAMERDGATVGFDQAAIERLLSSKAGDWKNLTVSELAELDMAVRNIKGAATTKATALLDGKRVDREELVEKLLEEGRKNLKSKGQLRSSASARTRKQKIVDGWNAFHGDLLKPETMILEFLGADNIESLWFRAIMRPLQESKYMENDLAQKTVEPILKAFRNVPKNVQRLATQKIDGRKLFPSHEVSSGQDLSPPTRRFELIMMTLHAGTESSLFRLSDGRNISVAQIDAAINLLTKEELDWVQSIWDAAESLWPLARALEERDSGLAPPKLEPRKIVTRHGIYRGGYFPAVYDSSVEMAGERADANAFSGLFDQSYSRPGTPHSHLKRRVDNFSGALSLEPTVIMRHIAQVTHDIAYREALKSVAQIIWHPKIQTLLKERLGLEAGSNLRQYLKDIGQMRGTEAVANITALDRFMRAIRGNIVMSALGYSLPNAIEDLSNLTTALPRTDIKAKHLAGAVAEMVASPIDSWKFATGKSGELRAMHSEWTRELRAQIQTLTTKDIPGQKQLRLIKDHSFDFLEYSGKFTSTPIWLASYRQAIADGHTDDFAVTKANSDVRKVFATFSPVDQAKILRSKGFIAFVNMFYSFLNVSYNGLRSIIHPLTQATSAKEALRQSPRVAGRLLAYIASYGVLSEFLRGRGREPDEDWMVWFLRKMLEGSLSPFPFGGDAAALIEGWWLHKRTNPRAVSVFGPMADVAKALSSSKEGTEKLNRVMRALGPFTGLPHRPIGSAGYLFDVVEGNEQPEDPLEAARGVIYGPPKRKH